MLKGSIERRLAAVKQRIYSKNFIRNFLLAALTVFALQFFAEPGNVRKAAELNKNVTSALRKVDLISVASLFVANMDYTVAQSWVDKFSYPGEAALQRAKLASAANASILDSIVSAPIAYTNTAIRVYSTGNRNDRVVYAVLLILALPAALLFVILQWRIRPSGRGRVRWFMNGLLGLMCVPVAIWLIAWIGLQLLILATFLIGAAFAMLLWGLLVLGSTVKLVGLLISTWQMTGTFGSFGEMLASRRTV